MARLGVNVDHVATVRQARGINEPDPVTAAALAELAGADSITVHLREDRRHIQDRDVEILRRTVKTGLNLEMAATDEMVAIACQLRPEMVTLVPEGRQEITTEGGLDVVRERARLKTVVAKLSEAGIRVSLFVDPDLKQIEAAAEVGATVCEVHTGPYAHAFWTHGRRADHPETRAAIAAVRQAGEAIRAAGMQFNAGHALNYANVAPIAALPGIAELHIGHAIISRALFVGLEQAVREMKALIADAAQRNG
ncbi:MAG TPA: pyridoxine 5'-phosphate synthase [Rhodocyclaceae bacterium]|nr:pyridoxine 5'-phosphate synthase [Rhodocyclaceae bacterium]